MDSRNDDAPRESAHEEALLLPWYLNGTLSREERDRVDRHLVACARCRDELALWTAVDAEVHAPFAAPVPHPAQLQRLMGRLDEPGGPLPSEPALLPEAVGRSDFRRLPRRWRLALIGQAAAVAALLGWTALARVEPAAPFHTLSARPVERPTWRLRAVFADETSERELRALLVSLGASVVGGPSPLGVYTLEIPAALDPESTIAVLRTRPEVRFAELAAPRQRP